MTNEIKTKSWDEIDVSQILSEEDFCTLFNDRLPLTLEEKLSLNEYYQIYEAFINAGVKPQEAWVVTRNIFAVKNQHIGERIKNV